MNLVKYNSPEEAIIKAAEALNLFFLENSQSPILFLSSGGSSLVLLDRLEPVPELTLGVIDERFSTDPHVNNFSQLKNSLLASKVTNFIDTSVREGETIEQLAQRYEEQLKEWVKNNPEGKIVATLGMGPDGHVAGILPFPENPKLFAEFFEGLNWVVSYDATGKNPYPLRVATTLTFLKRLDFAVSLITGEEKIRAFHRLNSENGNLQETPARILRELESVSIFTDINN